MRKTIRGFTIVELIVVIAVLGILATIGVISYGGVQTKTRDSQRASQITIIADALENYYSKNGEYPSCKTMSALPPTVTATLTGLDPSVLKTPTAASGANSIQPSCSTELAPGSTADVFAYVGNNNTTCLTASGQTAACTQYTLEYREEATGQIKKLTSRHISFTFVKAWGGTDFDTGRSLVQTSDGGYAVTGLTDSYGASGDDMFLAKYTSNGTLSWSKTWGGTGDDIGFSLVQTSDGGYAVTGYTTSFADTRGNMFLAKYDSAGNLSWSKTWNGDDGSGGGWGYSLVQTSDGGYAVTGLTAGYAINATDSDIFLAKYDSAGNLSWSKTLGGPYGDRGYSLVQTSDGGYAVTGMMQCYGAGTYDVADMFLAKYDSVGNLSWIKTWGGGDDDGGDYGDYGQSLVQTSDGGYAVTGWTTSYGDNAYGDMFLAKYDSAGNLSWNKTWGSANADAGYSLVQTSDGGYAVTGHTDSYGVGGDMFLAKYDSAGNLSWIKTWGSANADVGYSLVQTSDGGYAVTGSTGGYGVGSDMFLAKYNSSGVIANCSSPMCQSPTTTVTTPTARVTTPTVTVTTPTVTVTTPTVTEHTITATSTVIVAP